MPKEKENTLTVLLKALGTVPQAQIANPATVDQHQLEFQPQKLPPLPHFDGKDPKHYHTFENSMLEAYALMMR